MSSEDWWNRGAHQTGDSAGVVDAAAAAVHDIVLAAESDAAAVAAFVSVAGIEGIVADAIDFEVAVAAAAAEDNFVAVAAGRRR